MTAGCQPDKEVPSDGTEGTTKSGESGESETTSETIAETDTMNFIHDMVSPPSLCDPWEQDCPDGEKCVPYSNDGGPAWNANKCVPITGDGVAGDSCIWSGIVEGTDDCGSESICWDATDVEGQLVGVCKSFCGGTKDAPLCEPGTSCNILNDGTINLCLPTCDPLLQDCEEGLACYWANTDFNCVNTTQDIPTGEPCGYLNDCAAGNLCTDAAALPSCNGDACCAPFCDIANPNCDAIVGTECVTFFDEGLAPPGFEDVGVCVLPE